MRRVGIVTIGGLTLAGAGAAALVVATHSSSADEEVGAPAHLRSHRRVESRSQIEAPTPIASRSQVDAPLASPPHRHAPGEDTEGHETLVEKRSQTDAWAPLEDIVGSGSAPPDKPPGFGSWRFGPGRVDGGGWGPLGTGKHRVPYPEPGPATGRGGLATHRPVPGVVLGSVSSDGDPEQRAIIARYIRMNLSKIAHCHARELVAHPALAGTVSTHFTIRGDGTVDASRATGITVAVASCIADAIGTIEFPAPKDGGSVRVSLPIAFRPG